MVTDTVVIVFAKVAEPTLASAMATAPTSTPPAPAALTVATAATLEVVVTAEPVVVGVMVPPPTAVCENVTVSAPVPETALELQPVN